MEDHRATRSLDDPKISPVVTDRLCKCFTVTELTFHFWTQTKDHSLVLRFEETDRGKDVYVFSQIMESITNLI